MSPQPRTPLEQLMDQLYAEAYEATRRTHTPPGQQPDYRASNDYRNYASSDGPPGWVVSIMHWIGHLIWIAGNFAWYWGIRMGMAYGICFIFWQNRVGVLWLLKKLWQGFLSLCRSLRELLQALGRFLVWVYYRESIQAFLDEMRHRRRQFFQWLFPRALVALGVLLFGAFIYRLWSSGANKERTVFLTMEQMAARGFNVPTWVIEASKGRRNLHADYSNVNDVGRVQSFEKDEIVPFEKGETIWYTAPSSTRETSTITITETTTVPLPQIPSSDQATTEAVVSTTTITKREKGSHKIVTHTEVLTSTMILPTIIANVTPTTMIHYSTIHAPERTITIYGDEVDVGTSRVQEPAERERREVGSGGLEWCERCKQRHCCEVED